MKPTSIPSTKAAGTTSNFMPATLGRFDRSVTVTYGLRWSLLREPYDANNQMASFSLAD